MSLVLTGILLILRTLFVWSSLGAGAKGGTITPSVANGALLGVLLGGFWHIFVNNNVPLDVYALVGASAFLGAAKKMPITGIILILEFTHYHLNLLVPMLISGTLAFATAKYCEKN